MRLLIADDHALTRAGIRHALQNAGLFTVVAEADTSAKVLPLVGRTEPDVVLLDTDMPGQDSLACLERLQARFPNVTVLMLADDASPTKLQAAFARGARGWIMKTIDPADLAAAIASALDAKVFVPYGPVHDDSESARQSGITERELEIVRLLGLGLSNKAIAAELWVTVQTVKFHLTNIYRKLGLANRTAVARWAHEAGLLLGTHPHGELQSHLLERTRRPPGDGTPGVPGPEN
jgi:DNA-binding NarL/FixJ family response regulator